MAFFWNRRKSFGIYNKESIVEKEKTTIHQEANSNKQSKITQVGGHYERH